MYVTAIVLAAGKGLRFKSKIPKPLVKIKSQPIIIYSLAALNIHPLIKDIVVVAEANNLRNITGRIKQYRINKVIQIVKGGLRRQDSVYQGLQAVDRRSDLVLIHDGVRPFINKDMVSRVIRKAKRYGAAIVGVPVKATIKKIKSKFIVEKTLDRDNLWEIQTPQVFKKDLILKAYDKFRNSDVTDDAMLVEKLGVKVSVVLGSYSNIKITTPEDLVVAEAICHIK